MKKITLLFCVVIVSSFSAVAQFSFPIDSGSYNVTANTLTNIVVNDSGNTAGVATGLYGDFVITVNWAQGNGSPWSLEAELQVTTSAGVVDAGLPIIGGERNSEATTLTFSGVFSEAYNPSVDGTLILDLGQFFSGTDANWSNINITLNPFAPNPPATVGVLNILGCPDADSSDVTTTSPGEVVWLELVYNGAEDCAPLILDTLETNGGITDTELGVYNSKGHLLVSNDDGAGGVFSYIEFDDLAAGTYYLAVSTYDTVFFAGAFNVISNGTATGNIVVNAYTSVANDECSGAMPLTLGQEMPFNNSRASDSENGSPCNPGDVKDLWYSFVAPVSGEVTIATTAAHHALFLNCAGGLLSCDTVSVSGLLQGEVYYIAVTDAGTNNGLQSGTITISDATLSIYDFDNNVTFIHFPNPVNSSLTLKAQNNIQNVSVYNMLGQEVLRSIPNTVDTTVDMSALQSGAYFVKVSINGATETVRVIKN